MHCCNLQDIRVSILVLLDVDERPTSNRETLCHFAVSILVLLDVDERRMVCFCLAAPGSMFQSLFSWMSMKGDTLVVLSIDEWNVSILVLLDVDERPAYAIPFEKTEAEFQSLFSWMSMKGSKYRYTRCFCVKVSILVLLDVDERPTEIALWGAPYSGFNPCSPGCR